MTGLEFVQDLAIVMAVSAITTLLCHAIRLPVVLGYIIAGILIGPHISPYPLVVESKSIETLANLGVIFLMFSIGLEFNLKKLRRLGVTAFIATSLEVLLMIWIGFSVGRMLGWKLMDCLFLGAILSISSTTIIATVLIELKLVRERFAQIIIAILIMEDLLAILIIAVLSALAITGTVTLGSVSYSMLKVAVFMLLSVILGVMTVPKLIHFVSKLKLSQILIVVILGLCFGFSLLGAKLGFSLALGAFLIGAVVAESEEIADIIRKVEPLRDMFIALFFVSVGMLLDLHAAAGYWFPILVVTAAVILGKYSCVSFAVFLTGHEARTALMAGLALTQIGEFSFIIAQMGESTRVTEHSLFPIAVSVSMISSTLTPIFIRDRWALASSLQKLMPSPLVTFAEFYTSWISKLRIEARKADKSSFWARLGKYAFPVCVNLILIAGIFVMGLRFSIHAGHFPFPYWILVGLAIFPFWIGLVYSLDKLLWNILFGRSQEEDSLPAKLIRNMFRLGILIALSLLVLTIGFPFLPNVPLLLMIGLALFFVSLLFWTLITKFHAHLEETMTMVFEKEEPGVERIEQEKARHELEELIKNEYPWEVLTEDVLVPYKPTAINQPIHNLKLSQITGATIMAIYREDGTVVNPPPETVVMPGDVLVVMGEKEQIQNAVRYLSELMSKPAAFTAQDKPLAIRVVIDESSPAIRRTLATLTLRTKTGVSVIGLQRADGASITNPPPSTEIIAGDTLILFGTEEQISKARKLLLG
ncbi:MAG: cation:proton antiporter [Candidatus Omnitrophica bacterium]|nr:cation:proton antiporter [Candidatus Omnitrophota bacterium]